MKGRARDVATRSNSRYMIGIVVLLVGVVLLFQNLGFPMFDFAKFWPVVVIILAFVMLSKK